MVRYINFPLLLPTLAMVSGCLAVGLKRTPIDSWEKREFGDIGLCITLPKKALFVGTLGVKKLRREGTGWITFRFGLHSVSSGHLLAEPMYLVHFRFNRLSPEQHAIFRRGTHSLSYDWIWKDHHDQQYDTTQSFRWRDMGRDVLGWRRDYHCANGDVVVAGVEYILLAENARFKNEDIRAIERVLSSVAEIPVGEQE